MNDYKTTNGRAAVRPVRHSAAGPLLIGIFIGLVLGLTIALGVAWYINKKMPSPFLDARPKHETAQPQVAQPQVAQPQVAPSKSEPAVDEKTKAAEAKPRFEFYKILPGDEVVTDQQFSQAATQPPAARAKNSYFLQAGAFQNSADADRMKAQLALIGVEARVRTTTLPDRGIWHRVRLGPFSKLDELNRVRTTLKQNGIDASLIKVRE